MRGAEDVKRWCGSSQEVWRSQHSGSQSSVRGQRINDATLLRSNRAGSLPCMIQSYPTTTMDAGNTKNCLQQFVPLEDLDEFAQTIRWSSFVLAKRKVGIKTQQRRADLRQMGQQTATVSVQCGLLAEQNLQQTILCATQWSNHIIWNRNNVPHTHNKTNIVLISLETKAVRHIHRKRNAYKRWMIKSIADRGLRRVGDEHRCKPQCFFFWERIPC